MPEQSTARPAEAIAAVMQAALAAREVDISKAFSFRQRANLQAAISRPELQPLLNGIRIEAAAEQGPAICLKNSGLLTIRPSLTMQPGLLTIYLRHALELRLLAGLRASAGRLSDACVEGMLALNVTLDYILQLSTAEQRDAGAAFEGYLAELLAQADQLTEQQMSGSARSAQLWRWLPSTLEVIGLQPGAAELDELRNEALQRTTALLDIARPAETLLTEGGDDRLRLDPRTALNGYGCSPRPRPWAITFSSSTASSISDYAYFVVERWRQSALRSALRGQLDSFMADAANDIRGQIRAVCGIPDDAQLILTSSGTDGELFALWLAILRAGESNLLNLIVGPMEVGSGTMDAASGRHFSPESPIGGCVESGHQLRGLPGKRIRVDSLPLRDSSGQPMGDIEFEQALSKTVATAIAAGEFVLLHLVDASKTGLMAPTMDAMERLLSRHGERVIVVVDAAQLRLSQAGLQAYLQRGFMVLITGSKFFTGPPFSGTLAVPAELLEAIQLRPVPAGFADYATQGDLPESLRDYAAGLPSGVNQGLLARWQAALWEMDAFTAVPPAERLTTLDSFARRVRKSLDELPNLQLVSAPVRDCRIGIATRDWDALPTIFTFLIGAAGAGADGHRWLSYEEGRLAYHWLNADVSAGMPKNAAEADLALARQCCHTGQPVKLAQGGEQWLAGMRVAAGARLVSGVHFDPQLGTEPQGRLSRELDDLTVVLRKAALIGRYWAHLQAWQRNLKGGQTT